MKKSRLIEIIREEIETKLDDKKREELSDYAHDAWSRWMKHLFSKSKDNEDGTVTIPKWAVDRWKRQLSTPYNKLSKDEKDSDRDEADDMIDIVDESINEDKNDKSWLFKEIRKLEDAFKVLNSSPLLAGRLGPGEYGKMVKKLWSVIKIGINSAKMDYETEFGKAKWKIDPKGFPK